MAQYVPCVVIGSAIGFATCSVCGGTGPRRGGVSADLQALTADSFRCLWVFAASDLFTPSRLQ